MLHALHALAAIFFLLPAKSTWDICKFLVAFAKDADFYSFKMAYKGQGGKVQKVMVQPIVSLLNDVIIGKP